MSTTIESPTESVRRFAQRYEDRIAELGARLAKAEAERDMLRLEAEDLRKKVGRMAETDARWDAMRRDLENTIAERDECYMKLPVDADGVPIRLGDVVAEEEFCPEGGTVVGMKTYSSIGRWLVNCGAWVDSRKCRHAKPNSVAEELAKFLSACGDDDPHHYDEQIEEFAERIRKAVE